MFQIPVPYLKIFVLHIALLVPLLPAKAISGQTSLDIFLDKVEANSKNVSTFSCDFRQERHLSIFPKPVKFTGKLLLKKPDRLRWEFLDPIPSVLILNGRSGVKCEPRGRELTFSLDSDPVMRLVAKQLWSWTGGNYRDLADDFNMELLSGPILKLTPVKKGGGNFIEEINVRFDSDTLQPIQVIIEEPGDDRTMLFFSNYLINLQFPDTYFTECQMSLPDKRKQ